MDGISSNLAAASALLASSETATAVQTQVLGHALEQAEEGVMTLLEGLGENVDVSV